MNCDVDSDDEYRQSENDNDEMMVHKHVDFKCKEGLG